MTGALGALQMALDPAEVRRRTAPRRPSARGELEMTDPMNLHLPEGRAAAIPLDGSWCDAGRPSGLAGARAWAGRPAPARALR